MRQEIKQIYTHMLEPGWATYAIKDLKAGKTAILKPKGQSMKGKIESGSKVTVDPIKVEDIVVGDIVLCHVKGKQYLHLVKEIKDGKFLIGNNRGYTNGWTDKVYGKAVKIESPNNQGNK